MSLSNGQLIIGTPEAPIPCDVKVKRMISGGINSRSFGTFPDSVPIGSKAIGGLGNVIMHGCQQRWWTTLENGVSAGDNSITVSDDISEWVVGDEIGWAQLRFFTIAFCPDAF